MAGLSHKTVSRMGAGTALTLLAVFLLPGCDDGYDPLLAYPLRTDPIVISRPSKEKPSKLDPPGQLDAFINNLPVDKKDDLLRPDSLPSNKRAELNSQLDKHFGTPLKPRVGDETDPEGKLDPATLAQGSLLYRRHCLHCHGLTGDGRGPTGPWVNPHPRDYRLGRFKFTSSTAGTGVRRATRGDLVRTVKYGIEGTSMPSFALLTDKETEDIVSYVIHLAIRGRVERDVMTEVASDKDTDVTEAAEKALTRELKAWNQTEKSLIEVARAPITPTRAGADEKDKAALHESIRRGSKLFLVGTAKCVSCHNDYGRANDYFYDDWGTIVRPANLTAGMYRGGRRPVDLFYRIHSGVNGSGMPSFSDTLKPDEIWDIVNFIQTLPYPRMLPEDIRKEVYGEAK